jgi:hypothetical protein
VDIAEQRIRAEQERRMNKAGPTAVAAPPARRKAAAAKVPVKVPAKERDTDFLGRAQREGHKARELAQALLERCGFADVAADVRMGHGIEVSFTGTDRTGQSWFFDVSGAFTSTRAGLRRTDALWKALGKAAVLHATHPDIPLVLLTTDAPVAGSAGDLALRALRHDGRSDHFGSVFDVVEMESADDHARLRRYASKGPVVPKGRTTRQR